MFLFFFLGRKRKKKIKNLNRKTRKKKKKTNSIKGRSKKAVSERRRSGSLQQRLKMKPGDISFDDIQDSLANLDVLTRIDVKDVKRWDKVACALAKHPVVYVIPEKQKRILMKIIGTCLQKFEAAQPSSSSSSERPSSVLNITSTVLKHEDVVTEHAYHSLLKAAAPGEPDVEELEASSQTLTNKLSVAGSNKRSIDDHEEDEVLMSHSHK